MHRHDTGMKLRLATALALLALFSAAAPVQLQVDGAPRAHASTGTASPQPAARADTGDTRLYLPFAGETARLDRDERTLVITHLPALAKHFGLAPDSPEILDLRQRLDDLVARPSVAGRLVFDLTTETDAAVAAAYRSWEANLDPTQVNLRANILATALRDWIWRNQANRWPALRYLVIVGDDRVVPFYRLQIDPPAIAQGWETEEHYFDEGTVGAGTTVGAALAADLALNDDFYAAPLLSVWGGKHEYPLPELAVGRLVERPTDILAVIDAFSNQSERPLRRSLVAGYDFMQDGIEAVEPRLATVLPARQRASLVGSDWTSSTLKAALFGPPTDLFYFALHATHFFATTPNNGVLMAQDVVDAPIDLAGMVVVGLACHAGLNVPGEDHPRPLDFPEAWARRGATLVASPGWAFGGGNNEPGLRYQEVLMARYTELLLVEGGANVGDALVEAKRSYVDGWTGPGGVGVQGPNAFQVKTAIGTVLYGLPMYRLVVGIGHER